MAKRNTNSGKCKQDTIVSQFKNDIRQLENRNWLTIAEQAILNGEKQKQKASSRPEQIRISHYVPNHPLNGSSTWSKQKRQEFKSTK